MSLSRPLRSLRLVSFLLLLPGAALAGHDLDLDKTDITVPGPEGEPVKLARVSYESVVDATPTQVWEALIDFGNVHQISKSIYESDVLGETPVGEGCERYCNIKFQGLKVHVKERIIEFEETADASWFVYDVYEWRNFPLAKNLITFGVRTNEAGQTVLFNIVDYRLRPNSMTEIMRGQMRKTAMTGVLGTRLFVETGEGQKTLPQLRKLYPDA